jgi:uncharacterized protein YbjT (DUF2867 family)
LDRGWSGHHCVGVHGPKDLSTDEAAAIISSALGKPVKCVDATLDQARGAMKGIGSPTSSSRSSSSATARSASKQDWSSVTLASARLRIMKLQIRSAAQ